MSFHSRIPFRTIEISVPHLPVPRSRERTQCSTFYDVQPTKGLIATRCEFIWQVTVDNKKWNTCDTRSANNGPHANSVVSSTAAQYRLVPGLQTFSNRSRPVLALRSRSRTVALLARVIVPTGSRRFRR